MFLSLDALKMRYRPFPIGIAQPAMPDDLYERCIDAFPPLDLFDSYDTMLKPGKKYTLSEKENPKAFRDFIQSSPVWGQIYADVKSDAFVYGVLDALRSRDIDLGPTYLPPARRVFKRFKDLARGRLSPDAAKLKARFEFSALPADGGHLNPHTDAPTKIVTLIVSMMKPGEWDPAFGGGTDVNVPKDDRWAFNQMNRRARLEDMDVLATYDYAPNQAVLFVKTFNSWHSVPPMTGKGATTLRKTLTINIERFL
ncbi:MAG TPA: hypothetical protein PK694_01220 [Rhodospirillales bacterium]|jgi:hypothetical protein|nr:hypothetical protein [Rhodospirillales bacterium]